MSGVEPDMPVIAATRRRAELERLTGMGARVKITNPDYPDAGWTGRIIGLMDQPSILIEMDNGRRHACPQAFAVQELRCICGPDETGEAPDCRSDCPLHGADAPHDAKPGAEEAPF